MKRTTTGWKEGRLRFKLLTVAAAAVAVAAAAAWHGVLRDSCRAGLVCMCVRLRYRGERIEPMRSLTHTSANGL